MIKRAGMFKRRWSTVASAMVLTLSATVLVVYAASADGNPVRHVELNDGGIWVTSDRDGLFGRLNKPAGSLDAAFYPPGGAQRNYVLDVVQQGSAVVARDQGSGKLMPVDVTRAAALADQAVPLPAAGQVQMDGGTVAVLDPKSGKVWASRVDPTRGLTTLAALNPSSPPVASVGGTGSDAGVALAVGTDGAVYAVSAAGKVATLRVNGRSQLDKPEYTDLGRRLGRVRVTAVGSRLVVFDAADGTLIVPGGPTATIAGTTSTAVLQAPGPEDGSVIIATSTTLLSADLSTGRVTTLSRAGKGAPAVPVRLANCVHAAWAGTRNGYVRSCDGHAAKAGNLKNSQTLVHPVFRVNRDAIVLNDLATGAVWDLSTQRKADDWASVKPPPVVSKNDKTNDNPDQQAPNRPPRAVDDTLGSRPGRTTLLHVLDNDSDPAGRILSVSAITAADNPDARLSIAPDGQTVAFTAPEQAGQVHFKYTVDDGNGLNATAAVTVLIRGTSENKPPELRPGYQPVVWALPAGGRLSLPVLADWRDFDGDPVVLAGVDAKAGSASTTPDGFIDFVAPPTGGAVQLQYRVSDGVGAPVTGTVKVTVQDPSATQALPPVAEPDVARGEVGQPITIHPLDNDLPGSDPTDVTAKLQLAGDVVSPEGAAVVTDVAAGSVTVTASAPGTYLLDYTAAFGNAPFAKAAIRVDVVAAPPSPVPPVAMPDDAVLRGQVPAVVDVLANDFDPAGGLLVVQHAGPAAADAPLQVAIVRNRWLRITALAPSIGGSPLVVKYAVTDGVTGPVTGEVVVTQLPPPASDVPVPKDDYATVRAGDFVTMPVLENDTSVSGAQLSLAGNVPGAPTPGRLPVSSSRGSDAPADGMAYVDGNAVRYVAPAAVNVPTSVTVSYVVRDPNGDQAIGRAHVTVTPAPGPNNPNRPPSPHPIEARAVAGESLVLNVATTGVDPDGDSVSVTGIGSAPSLGRVLGFNGGSLTYQAYPTSGGTDTFTYQVTDRFGRTGTSTVRVAVTPPGAPQPPVAVDDVVTAAPGAHLSIDVLANDLRAPDDPVTVEPLKKRNPDLPAGVSLSSDNMLRLTAPALTGKPLVIVYAITDGTGEASVATVSVHSQKAYDAPPTTHGIYPSPAPDATSTEVDVLAQCGCADPDGNPADLTVTKVFDPQAKLSRGRITVPVTDQPHTVAYEIRDAGGATAVGLIYVAATGTAGPRAKPGQTIALPRNGSKTVDIADYVIDAPGKQVKLTTTDRIWASPSKGLQAASRGDQQLVLTARGDYNGPAAVTFEVTDGASLTDPAGRYGVVTVPVQVGPEVPILRCPSDPLTVIGGGVTVAVDISSACHVWLPDPTKLPGLKYTATWQSQPTGVSLDVSGGRTVDITASASATPGATGTVTLAVAGSAAAPAQLPVRVVAAAPPSVAPVLVDGIKAGDTTTVNLVPYVRSQLRDAQITVVSVAQASGMPAVTSVSGSSVRISPGRDAHGTMTFAVTVTDVAGDARPDRRATGQITLRVLGVPDAPGTPVPGRTVLSKSVDLAWSAPANNGAPIDTYEVSYSGGKQTCPASPCTITGLTNGTGYTFTVRAHNLVGWGAPSPVSAVARPDTVPGAVTGLTTSNPQDGTLHLSWNAPPNEGSPVQRYEVTWTGGGHQTVTSTEVTATGLANDARYTFKVTAVNAHGPGPAAAVQGQSAGAPPSPAAPTFTSANSANRSSRAVTISWAPVDPNGPGPATYTLTRTGGGTKTVCRSVTATSCTDDGLANDGTIYTYSVTAANAAAATDPTRHTSPPSPGTQMEATATPDPIRNVSAAPTGSDGQAVLHFDAPASHGATNTVTCTWSGGPCGTWPFSPNGQTGVTETVNGLPNGQNVTLTLTACNGSHGGTGAGNPCDSPASVAVTTYGPLRDLAISTGANGPNVDFTVSVNPNGKPATVTVRTSRQTQTFTTGVGAWSWSSSDNVGYNSSDTINVTVADSGRGTLTQSRTQATGPPPPPSITAWQGNAGWSSIGTCTSSASGCNWLAFQVHNFPTGRYTWTCISNGGVSYQSTATVNITDPNQTFATQSGTSGQCVFGRGITEQIELNGVTSNAVAHNP